MSNFKITKLFVTLLVVFLVFGWKPKTAHTQSTGDKPVEQVRKNIQVLKGLPDSQLFLVMNFVGDSLGVNCDHCHVKGEKNPQTGEDTWLWEREDKKEKQRGREMMRMVLELNRSTTFNREGAVSCYTCHRGSTRPERLAPLPPHDYFAEGLKPQPPKRVLPTAQEIISKYLSAVGANRQDVLSQAFVMRGTVERIERAKASGPTEIVAKQPNKVRITETLTSGVVTRGWNGTSVWFQSSRGVTPVTGENLKQLKSIPTTTIASDGLFRPIKIPDSTSGATLMGVAKINDRDTYRVRIEDTPTPSNQTRAIQLFFDVETGLLLRRMNVTNTMLGPLNVQWDFSDYRDVSGVKLPFSIRTSDVSSYDTVLRKFSEIKIDSSLGDGVFDVPRIPSTP